MNKQRILKAFSILALFACLGFFSSCIVGGNPSEEEYGEIQISGTLLSAGPSGAPGVSKFGADTTSGTPLVGYQLYCVTFTEPVVKGSGIADASGNVKVTLKVNSAAFSCSILDSTSKGVAYLFFSDSSGNKGQAVSGSGDINLKIIAVSLADGVAAATVPSNVTILVDGAWTPTSTTNAPSARTGPTSFSTGNEMIIWGG